MAAPNYGKEGDEDQIRNFLTEKGYDFPVVMDTGGELTSQYAISSYPTTFIIDKDGNVYGYVSGALTGEMMESIVKQTMEGKK